MRVRARRCAAARCKIHSKMERCAFPCLNMPLSRPHLVGLRKNTQSLRVVAHNNTVPIQVVHTDTSRRMSMAKTSKTRTIRTRTIQMAASTQMEVVVVPTRSPKQELLLAWATTVQMAPCTTGIMTGIACHECVQRSNVHRFRSVDLLAACRRRSTAAAATHGDATIVVHHNPRTSGEVCARWRHLHPCLNPTTMVITTLVSGAAMLRRRCAPSLHSPRSGFPHCSRTWASLALHTCKAADPTADTSTTNRPECCAAPRTAAHLA